MWVLKTILWVSAQRWPLVGMITSMANLTFGVCGAIGEMCMMQITQMAKTALQLTWILLMIGILPSSVLEWVAYQPMILVLKQVNPRMDYQMEEEFFMMNIVF